MSVEQPMFVLRGSKGISFFNSPPNYKENDNFKREENPHCRDMAFSKDGTLFAWCTNQKTIVINTATYKNIMEVDNPRVSFIHLSPKGTYLCTWEPYSAKQNQQDSCNLHVYNISTGECVKSFIQKKQFSWNPQWSEDEFLCARNVNNEVQFFEDSNFNNIAKKIFLQKVAYFSLAPGEAPYHAVCFVPGIKGQPSFVRLFKYPNFEGSNSVIAQKSFFKAERTDFYWNKTGKDCIFLTSVDVDKTGASYYGELNLYYASVKGDTAKIKLGKDGPVYSIKWSPCSSEFCVVYGYMPAQATIYNVKCEPVFDFAAGPRNEVHYSPVGNRLLLCGFGNLQGYIEVWDLKQRKQICKFQVRDTTMIEWSYDGEHIVTSTTSPRLRIGNGYRIWHYTGSLLIENIYNPLTNEELFDLKWKPVPEGYFKAKPTVFTPVPGIQSIYPAVSKEVYRPPCAQGKPSSFKLHDEEATQNDSNNVTMSKNKKKNLARKAKKNENNASNAQTESGKSYENDKKTSFDKPFPTKDEASYKNELTGDPEKDKKIRSLLKKLDQIEKLKKDQASGKKLEMNQLEKIGKADELEAELNALQIN